MRINTRKGRPTRESRKTAESQRHMRRTRAHAAIFTQAASCVVLPHVKSHVYSSNSNCSLLTLIGPVQSPCTTATAPMFAVGAIKPTEPFNKQRDDTDKAASASTARSSFIAAEAEPSVLAGRWNTCKPAQTERHDAEITTDTSNAAAHTAIHGMHTLMGYWAALRHNKRE